MYIFNTLFHLLSLIVLFVIQSTCFSPVLFYSIPVNLVLLVVIYHSFYSNWGRGIFFTLLSGFLLESASAVPSYFYILVFAMVLIITKQLVHSSINITPLSIMILTVIYTLLINVLIMGQMLLRSENLHTIVPVINKLPYELLLNTFFQWYINEKFQKIDTYFVEKRKSERQHQDVFFKSGWWR